ncbi:MAG: PBP1A family penicillin-binding protein [Rickettsiales bacterium]|jgi:penicillin-binding protein 1A|nr:PBP1A family penicillin-binding protein [Rickettsiales bacterium]
MFRRKFDLILRFIYVGAVSLLFAAYCLLAHYAKKLPKHSELKDYQPPITSRVYSNNGLLLKEYAEEKRLFVSIDDIPDLVKQAFISAEDKNFYKNSGLDLTSILSAFIYNVSEYFKNGSTKFRGGSTITQQVVKNILLSNEKTLERKIKEAILAVRITRNFSKNRILELYLNHIFLGNNSYGVASAALTYFDKSLDELTVEEAALLASLPKAPGRINPTKNYQKAIERRNWVLDRMRSDGYIDEKTLEKARNREIVLRKQPRKEDYFNFGAFVEEVRKSMLDKFSEKDLMESGLVISTTIEPEMQKILDKSLKNGLESYDIRYGYRGALGNLYVGDEKNFLNDWPKKLKNFNIEGYYRNNWRRAVVLDFDSKGQKIVIGMLQHSDTDIKSFDEVLTIADMKIKKSYLALENIKWAVNPIILSANAKGNENEAKVKYTAESIRDVNLNVGDVILVENSKNKGYTLRQVPLANGGAVAIDPHSGRVLAMVGGYVDSEINFNRVTQAKRQPGSAIKPFVYLAAFEEGYNPSDTIMDEEIVLVQGSNLPTYRPHNFDSKFHGLVTLRKAIQNSYNVSTVRLASQIGLRKVVGIIKRFGINRKPRKLYSVALGSLETHLIDLTLAYSMIINGGKRIGLSTIEKVQDKYGKVIFRRDDRPCEKCTVRTDNIDDVEVPFLEDSRPSITDPASAYQITYILEGTVKYGTAWRARNINGKIIGGKTGTSNDFRDAWFMGCTPDLVIGIYVGFDDNKTLGNGETGSRVAAPIFVEAIEEILKDRQSVPFRIPEGITFRKIDVNSGREPTLASQKNNIILEAFKSAIVDGDRNGKMSRNINNDQLEEFGIYMDYNRQEEESGEEEENEEEESEELDEDSIDMENGDDSYSNENVKVPGEETKQPEKTLEEIDIINMNF